MSSVVILIVIVVVIAVVVVDIRQLTNLLGILKLINKNRNLAKWVLKLAYEEKIKVNIIKKKILQL